MIIAFRVKWLAIMLTGVSMLEVQIAKFNTVYGTIEVRNGKSATDTVQAKSLLMCAVICESRPMECSVVKYTISSGECVFYHWLNVGAIRVLRDPFGNLDTSIIVKQSASHILMGIKDVTYDILFSEANSFCTRIGGTVSSETELTYARSLGWDYCDCGWLDDGYAYFWVFVADISCGKTDFHRCSVGGRNRFDVHCTVK